jgi:benzoyl-CoA reductase/2-hydroxyglutaryl-CoA dehydratase subunit BcrC/BadD/HgdB
MTATARETAEIFESFAEARRQGFVHVKSRKEQGYGVVGVFCSCVPVELFTAAGLVPVPLCPAMGEALAEGSSPVAAALPAGLGADTCPPLRAAYQAARAGTCPYIYFADLLVGETSCTGKTRMYGLLGQLKDLHIMELPGAKPGVPPGAGQGESGRTLWLAELLALRKKLEAHFRVEITEVKLREAIRRRNRERRLLKELYELSRAKPPPLTGLRLLQVLHGAQFRFDHGETIRELEETIDRLKAEYAGGKRPVPEGAGRLLVTGCPAGATEQTVRLIEESGAVVVAYDTGAQQYERQVPETGDPYQALCDYYLGIAYPETNCPGPPSLGPRRHDLLERLCAQFAVDGLIEITLPFCHQVEPRAAGELATTLGLPFLSLALKEPGTRDMTRMKDRIAAFMSGLRRNRKENAPHPCGA